MREDSLSKTFSDFCFQQKWTSVPKLNERLESSRKKKIPFYFVTLLCQDFISLVDHSAVEFSILIGRIVMIQIAGLYTRTDQP